MVAGFGRVLIGFGVVVLLFVAYQLWGTGLRETASQLDLRAQFDEQLDASSPTGRAPDGDANDEAGGRRQSPPPPSRGAPVGVLRIPKLGLDKVAVEGTDVGSLRKGPGHEPGTALPGMPGNAVIGGHRTTYGAPFYHLDKLAPDDLILVDTPSGTARYVVTGSHIVDPDDVWILEPTADDRLTLFTCTPRFSAASRLVVTARLTGGRTPGPSQPNAADRSVAGAGASAPDSPPLVEELAAPTGSLPAAAAWGAMAAIIATLIWLAGRRYRRVVAYSLGAPILAVVLFGTFEHVAALLPAAV